MILLTKASIILIVLLLFYKALLERESFFKSNRVYLLGCLLIAICLPFISLPKLVHQQGYIAEVIQTQIVSTPTEANQTKQIHETPSPVVEKKADQKSDELQEVPTPIQSSESTSPPTPPPYKVNWFLLLYLFGVLVLSINLLAQIASIIIKTIKEKDKIVDDDYTLINLSGEVEPCSFFRYIFINPSLYTHETYEQILDHEKIHVKQKHTLDLMLSELAVIAFWFNPFVWILRREIEKNIEYQTDDLLLNMSGTNKEDYQLNLVDIACTTRPLTITTNYNQSLIKQRILKMNGKRSNKFSYWKYAFLIPLLFALVLGLNRPIEALGQAIPLELEMDMDLQNPLLDPESDGQTMHTDSLHLNKPDPSKDKKSREVKNPTNREKNNENSSTNNIGIVKKPSATPVSSKIEITDCSEFEKTVAAGDLNRVKEILKTLDPDCLKIKKKEGSNMTSLQTLIENKKSVTKEKVTEDEASNCTAVRKALKAHDYRELRRILADEDLSCLDDIYGEPSEDISLLKGLLSYGANLSVDQNDVIHISDIGFNIDIDEEQDECLDENYLSLVNAIIARDEARIRKILATEDLPCPLNTDGISNDFPFIKELMKYHPEIMNRNGRSITVYGVGVSIDLDKRLAKPNSNNDMETLQDIENIIEKRQVDLSQATCLDLIYYIESGSKTGVKSILDYVDPNCFHRVTETTTTDEGSQTISQVYTPLILAAAQGDASLVRVLLESGASVDYAGDGEMTALMFGVRSGNELVVRALVEAGADINRKDDDGNASLDYANVFASETTTNYLISKGAKAFRK